MLSFHERGNILDNDSTIVIPVTANGYLTDEIKAAQAKFQEMNIYNEYETVVESGIRKMRNPVLICDGRFILFAIKDRIEDSTDVDYIKQGLAALIDSIFLAIANPSSYGEYSTIHETICLPKLGCGRQGLPWVDTRMLYEIYLQEVPINFKVYGDNIDPNEIWQPIMPEDLPPLPGEE